MTALLRSKTPGTAALLAACREWLHRYVVLSKDQGNVIAAWVLHTWAIEAWDCTPYLHITAAEKECGKSRLLETLEPIVYRACTNSGTTPAAMLRIINKEPQTLLLDEIDVAFGGNRDAAESMRGLLNAGFRRGAVLQKCDAKNHEVKEFKVFCAKAFAGIGRVPDTVESRSIVIEMRRKSSNEKVESLRFREVEEARKPLTTSLKAWATPELIETLRVARPDFPDGLGHRQEDISEPLLAIADNAGGDWPSTIRLSLLALFQGTESEDSSIGVTLLRDIRKVFATFEVGGCDRIPSFALANALAELEGQPWADCDRGKALSPNTMARRLKRFHIAPGTIRIPSGQGTIKGYLRDWFLDSWSRYVRDDPDADETLVTDVTPVTFPVITDHSPFGHTSQHLAITPGTPPERPHQSQIVTAVTSVTALQERSESNRFVTGKL